MRIVFIGTLKFSGKMLEKLIELKSDIVGVLTQKASKLNADFEDMGPICAKNKIPYRYVTDINRKDSCDWIRRKRPNIIFCFGFSQLLKKDILGIAPMGVVGFHPTMLPKNRGRHPLIWALILGLKRTGSTFFFMDEGADSGDILSQEEVSITQLDNAQTLYAKIIDTAAHQLETILPRLSKGDYKRIPQDTSKATYWRKRDVPDGKIDFRMSKSAIYNLVRALTHPYPGAHISYNGSLIKIWEAKPAGSGNENYESGKVLSSSRSGILVKCHDGAVLLTKHDFKTLPKKGEYLP